MEPSTTTINEEPEHSMANFQSVFDMFDKNENGAVCAAEFPNLVQATGVEATKSDIGSVMKKYDKDDDGIIDFSEFVDMIQEFETNKGDTTQENLRKAFREFDCDNSGYISPEELRHVVCNTGEKLTLEEAEELISMFDKNKDGQLSYEEFLEFYNDAMKN